MTEDKNNPRTERGARILEELKAKAAPKDTPPTEEAVQEEASPSPPPKERRGEVQPAKNLLAADPVEGPPKGAGEGEKKRAKKLRSQRKG